MPHSIIPHGLESYVTDWKMSPGIEHNGFIFMTGFTGADEGGKLAKEPIDQIEAVFRKIGLVLAEAGLSFENLVEMTSYHVGLRDHLSDFKYVRSKYVVDPYPAWTAIEVAGFVRKEVIVEIRCIAYRT